MKEVLKAGISDDNDDFEDYEPFEIGGLEKYIFMNDYIKNENTENLIIKGKKSGLFPHFSVGDVNIKKTLEKYDDFINDVKLKISGREQEKILFSFEENGIIFTGTIINLYSINNDEKELIFYSPSKLKAKNYLQAWITHLFVSLNADFKLKTTTFIGSDKEVIFPHIDATDAKNIFVNLYDIFYKANFELLPYFPKTSFEFVRQDYFGKEKTKIERLNSAISTAWKGSFMMNGEENEDRFYKFLFNNPFEDEQIIDEFINLSEKIFNPMFKFIKKDK